MYTHEAPHCEVVTVAGRGTRMRHPSKIARVFKLQSHKRGRMTSASVNQLRSLNLLPNHRAAPAQARTLLVIRTGCQFTIPSRHRHTTGSIRMGRKCLAVLQTRILSLPLSILTSLDIPISTRFIIRLHRESITFLTSTGKNVLADHQQTQDNQLNRRPTMLPLPPTPIRSRSVPL